MIRVLQGLLFATIAGALTFGAAASLNLNADDLAAGSAPVEGCDPDGVTVRWNALTPATNEILDQVVVSGIAGRCILQEVRITVTDSTGAVLGWGTDRVNDNSSATDNESIVGMQPIGGASIPLAEVEAVDVVITGAAAD